MATGGYQGTPGPTPEVTLTRLEERIAQLEGALIRLTERVDQLAGVVGGSTARGGATGGYQGTPAPP